MQNQNFSISEWFNALPIRVIGNIDFPMFYASDIATVLEIKNIHKSIANFDEIDIVNLEQREIYDVKTFKMHKGKLVEDPKMVLLTEAGVYRLIMTSRSERAAEFRKFIVNVIKKLRTEEITKLRIIAETAIMKSKNTEDISELTKNITEMQKELEVYKKVVSTISVFKIDIGNDPYKYIPKKDKDMYFMKQYGGDITGKIMYKYTYNASPSDYTEYELTHKIYISNREILFDAIDNFGDQTLVINEKAAAYCRYICDVSPNDIEEMICDQGAKIIQL